MQTMEVIAATEPKATKNEERVFQTLKVRTADQYLKLPDGSWKRLRDGRGAKASFNMFLDAGEEPFVVGDNIPGTLAKVAVAPYALEDGTVRTTRMIAVFDGESLADAAKRTGHVLRGTGALTPAEVEEPAAEAAPFVED